MKFSSPDPETSNVVKTASPTPRPTVEVVEDVATRDLNIIKEALDNSKLGSTEAVGEVIVATTTTTEIRTHQTVAALTLDRRANPPISALASEKNGDAASASSLEDECEDDEEADVAPSMFQNASGLDFNYASFGTGALAAVGGDQFFASVQDYESHEPVQSASEPEPEELAESESEYESEPEDEDDSATAVEQSAPGPEDTFKPKTGREVVLAAAIAQTRQNITTQAPNVKTPASKVSRKEASNVGPGVFGGASNIDFTRAKFSSGALAAVGEDQRFGISAAEVRERNEGRKKTRKGAIKPSVFKNARNTKFIGASFEGGALAAVGGSQYHLSTSTSTRKRT